jgi:hypothetical protein
MIRQRYVLPSKFTLPGNQHNLILCNLACRKKLMSNSFYFPEGMVCNQENLLLHLLNKSGLKCILSSHVYLYHYRRKTLAAFLEQTASYGCGRFQQTCVAWRSCHVLYVVPPIALLCLLGLLITGQMTLLLSLGILYFALAFMAALTNNEIRELGLRPMLAMLPLTGLVHLAYAYGWFRGIWALALRKISGRCLESPEFLLGRW